MDFIIEFLLTNIVFLYNVFSNVVTRAATRRFSTDVANSQESLSRTPQKASRSRLKSITEKGN